MKKKIKIGEMEIPTDYWSMKDDEKRFLCLSITETIIDLLEQKFTDKIPKMEILNLIIKSSIQTNEQDENYEVCQVLTDIQKFINE